MKKSYFLLLVFILGIATLYLFTDLISLITLESIKAQQSALLAQVQARPLLSGAVFSLIYISTVALSLPFASLLTLLGGALFGLILGTLLVVSSATLGAALVFLLTKTALGENLRQKLEASGKSQKLLSELKDNGFSYLLFLRFVPVFPFFIVNIAPAFVGMPLRTYLLATAIGILPGSAIYVNVGRSLSDIDSLSAIISPQILMAFALLGTLALVPSFIQKIKKK